METALALAQRIIGGRGYRIELLNIDGHGELVAVLIDRDGREFVLEMKERLKAEAEEPMPERPAPQPAPEPAKVAAPEPTRMVRDMTALFKSIELSKMASPETKKLAAQLQTCQLRSGDEQTIAEAAMGPAGGDTAALRDLLAVRREAPRAVGPPMHM